MAATGKNPQEEQDKKEQNQVDDSALDKVTNNIHVDELALDASSVDGKKSPELEKALDKKPNINIKSQEDTLGIGDISQYIQKTKEQATKTPKQETLTAKDGTDLTSLSDIYAVVPHKKGDHKLVFLRDDIKDSFIPDPKGRKKGSPYEKNGIKVYDVHADFMQYPDLQTNRGEPFTVWVVDSKDDLLKQLQSIHGGVGSGTNFLSPVYGEKTENKGDASKKKPAVEKPAKSETPVKSDKKSKATVPAEDALVEDEKTEIQKETDTKDSDTGNTTEQKRQLPEYTPKNEVQTIDLKKVVEEGDKKNAENTEKPFVLPKFEFDKEGNAVRENTETKSETKSETKPETKKEEPKKEQEPIKLELDKIAEKKNEQKKEIVKPEPKPEESTEVSVEDTTPAKLEAPVKPSVELDPTEEVQTEEVKPEEAKPEEVKQEEDREQTPQERPAFDLDAITEEAKPEEDREQTPQEEAIATAVNLDTLEPDIQTKKVPAPVAEKHTTPKKRSSTGLKIRIAGLIALPLLLVVVLIVMFPSLSSDNPNPDQPEVAENNGQQNPDSNSEEQPDPEQPDPEQPDPEQPEENTGSFTMNELQAKLEAQQIEARRVLNKAKLLDNREAIKFGTAALLKASKTLDLIKKNTTTADEVQKDAERVDYYLQKADEATNQ